MIGHELGDAASMRVRLDLHHDRLSTAEWAIC
jgi:hypothetical protein